MYKRSEKVAEAIHEEISGLMVKGLKDPRVGFATVTTVKVSDDLHLATIYYTIMGDDAARRAAQAGLESAKGYLRREIGRSLRLRHVPDIIFRYDDSIDYGMRIDSLLREIGGEESND